MSKSIIGDYLNYVNGVTNQAKGVAASNCLAYIVNRASYLREKGLITNEIIDKIACQLPPQGATTINVSTIMHSLTGVKEEPQAMMMR